MSAKFYTLLTDIGAAKLASAAALGVPLKITQMAVGDGGGVLPTQAHSRQRWLLKNAALPSICCTSIRRTVARLLLSR